MHRDLILAYDILAYIQKTDTTVGPSYDELRRELIVDREVTGEAEAADLTDALTYHLAMFKQHGFVTSINENECAEYSQEDDADELTVYYQLTWSGHDFLESQRKVVELILK